MMALCSCDYRDNTWLRVFTGFLRFFSAGPEERTVLIGATVQEKGSDVFSVDVGSKERLECSEQHATVWPGTLAVLDFDEVGKMVNNIMWPQVQQALMDTCATGRLLMGVVCLHVVLHKGDAVAASHYAESMAGVLERIVGCVESNTPFPKLTGLYEYLRSWQQAQVPGSENPRAISSATARRLAWWPKDLRAKEPGHAGVNLWPCAPMRDWLCFAPGAQYQHESCEYCCDPAHGSQGAAVCFDAQWTFARCCTTPSDRGYF